MPRSCLLLEPCGRKLFRQTIPCSLIRSDPKHFFRYKLTKSQAFTY
jgi:hypothetical protein